MTRKQPSMSPIYLLTTYFQQTVYDGKRMRTKNPAQTPVVNYQYQLDCKFLLQTAPSLSKLFFYTRLGAKRI